MPAPSTTGGWPSRICRATSTWSTRPAHRGSSLGIDVRLGLEVDYLPDHESWIAELTSMAPWDYLIGSVHYLTKTLVVDHPDHLSQRPRNATPPRRSGSVTGTLYTARHSHRGAFDFMAHPDLPKKFGRLPRGDLSIYYETAIARTAGDRHGLRDQHRRPEKTRASALYPIRGIPPTRPGSLGIPLLISSDAHAPNPKLGPTSRKRSAAARRSRLPATGSLPPAKADLVSFLTEPCFSARVTAPSPFPRRPLLMGIVNHQ